MAESGGSGLYTGRGKAKKLKSKKALKGTTARIPFLGGLKRRVPKNNKGAAGTLKSKINPSAKLRGRKGR